MEALMKFKKDIQQLPESARAHYLKYVLCYLYTVRANDRFPLSVTFRGVVFSIDDEESLDAHKHVATEEYRAISAHGVAAELESFKHAENAVFFADFVRGDR